MAKKEEQDQYGKFDFDDDLNFDFDAEFEPERPKKDRTPVQDIYAGASTTLKKKFSDPGTYKSIIRDALPEGLSKTVDVAEGTIDGGVQLVDEAVQQIRPTIGPIVRKINELTPNSLGAVKKATQALANKFSKERRPRYDTSLKAQEDESVQIMLASTFGDIEAKRDAQRELDQADDLVKDKIEEKRFKVSQSSLNRMTKDIAAMREYTTSFNMSYQKKSLELQFRSYFVQANLLKSFNEYRNVQESGNKALIKNTSLPDVVKTNNLELYGQESKRKFFSNINQSIFTGADRFKQAGDRIKKNISDKIKDYKEGLFAAEMGLEGMIMSRQNTLMDDELNGVNRTTAYDVGDLIATGLGWAAPEYAAYKGKEFLKNNPRAAKVGYSLGRFAQNPGAIFDMAKNTNVYKNSKGEYGEGGAVKKSVDWVADMFRAPKADMEIKNTSIGGVGEDQLYTQTKKARAIVDIIPGYLARILREITSMRTGDDKTPLTVYDNSSGKFKTESQMSSDIMHSLKKKAAKGTYGLYADSLYDEFKGQEEVPSQRKDEIKDFLSGLSRKQDIDFTAENIRKVPEYKKLSQESRDIIDSILTKKYEGKSTEASKNLYHLTSKINDVRSNTTDIRADIQQALKDGYGEALEKQGLVVKDEDGNYKIVEDKYYNLLNSSSTVGTSDVRFKENIKPFKGSGTSALRSIVNTPISNWNYTDNAPFSARQQYGDKTMVGPMLHDVKKNFGQDATAGKSAIDLVSLNGYNMAAIQELDKKVNALGTGETGKSLQSIDVNVQEILKLIKEGSRPARASTQAPSEQESSNRFSIPDIDTKELVKTLNDFKDAIKQKTSDKVDQAKDAFNNIDVKELASSLKFPDKINAGGYAGIAGNILLQAMKLATKGVADTTTVATKATKSIKDNVADPMIKLIGNNKELLKSAAIGAIKNSITATTAAVNFGVKSLFNVTDRVKNLVKGIKDKSIDFAKKTLHGAKDIYLPGNPTPVLREMVMRAGGYRDSITGKAIETMDDLMKLKGNVLDPQNRVVLTLDDMKDGVFDQEGHRIKTFATEMVTRGAGAAVWTAKKLFGAAKKGYEDLGKAGEKTIDLLKALSPRKRLNDAFNKFKGDLTEQIKAVVGAGKGTGGGGSCDCERQFLLLEQIRDILALSHSGRRVKEILARSKTKKAEAKNDQEEAEDNKDEIQRSILTQMRDIAASDKPREIVEDVLSRGNRKKEFKTDTTTGAGNRSWVKRMRDYWKSKGSDEQQDSGPMGPAPELVGPTLPSNEADSSSRYAGGSGALGLIGSIGSAASGILSKLPTEKYKEQAKGKLEDLRDNSGTGILGRAKGRFARGALKAGGIIGGIGSMFSALKSGSDNKPQEGASEANDPTKTRAMTAGEFASKLVAAGKERMLRGFKKSKSGDPSDSDGDGQRDNGLADRASEAAALREANEQRKNASRAASEAAANTGPRYLSSDGALEKMIGAVGSLISTFMGKAGTVLSLVTSFFGGGGLLSKALGAGKAGLGLVGKGIAAGYGAVKGLGSGIIGAASRAGELISKIPGAAKLGRAGMLGLRLAQTVGIASGGTMGVLAAGVSTAASVVMAALSSPVVVGAGAIAGAAYLGYKAYKYFTRNDIDDWQRIRVIQYGLDGTDATRSYNEKVIALENYFLDGRLKFGDAGGTINDKNVDSSEILEIFDIDVKDIESAKKLGDWIEGRFKPFFLHHVNSLFKINRKLKLSEVDKLTPDQQLDYLSKISFESGPYDKTTSPFKGLDKLSDNPEAANKIIKAKIQTIGLDKQKSVTKKVESGANAPDSSEAKNINKPVTSGVPPKSQTQVRDAQDKPPEKPQQDPIKSLPPNLQKNLDTLATEDGKQSEQKDQASPDNKSDTVTSSGVDAPNQLKKADGDYKTGDGGMKYITLGKDARLEGIHPTLLKNFLAMAEEYGEKTGKSLRVNEGFRSFQEQEKLYRTTEGAARPGTSLHEKGLAIDASSVQLAEMEEMGLLRKYGFTRPVRGETWHVEPIGIQLNRKLAIADPNYAKMMIEQGLGRGGGGVGSKKVKPLGGRDDKLSLAIFNSNQDKKVQVTESADQKSLEGFRPAAASEINRQAKQAASDRLDKNEESLPKAPVQGPTNSPLGAAGGKTAENSSLYSEGEKAPSDSATSTSSDVSTKDTSGKGDVKTEITKAAKEAGVEPNNMLMLSAMESGLDPNAKAKTSSATGLNQFIKTTWDASVKKYGNKYGIDQNTPATDVRANTLMGAEYLKENAQALRSVRPNPNFTDLYTAHFLGSGGAKKFFSADPNSVAAEQLPKAANANKSIFYEGGKALTVSQVYDKLNSRIQAKAKAFGIPLNTSGLKGQTIADISKDAVDNSSKKAPVTDSDVFFASKPKAQQSTLKGAPSYTSGSTESIGAQESAPQMSNASNFTMSRVTKEAPAPKEQVHRLDPDFMSVFQTNSEKQLQHLSSIDESISSQLVPQVKRMADTLTEFVTGVKGAQSQGSNQPETPAARPAARKSLATQSLLDNSRDLRSPNNRTLA